MPYRIDHDFDRYYRNSYAKRTVGEDVVPFYIREVTYDGPQGPEQFNDENLHHLRFHGTTFFRNGDEVNGEMAFGDLDLENPEIGYIFPEGRAPVWMAYHTQRNMMKGLTRHRVTRGMMLSPRIVQQIFDRERNAEKLSDIHFAEYQGSVLYKGMVAGKVEDGVVELSPEFAYLNGDAVRLFGKKGE